MSDRIRDAIEAASSYLREHPDEAKYTDSVATARVVDGLSIRVEGPNGESLSTDMPSGVGGGAVAPSPGWYFRASLAACVTSLAVMRASELGIGDLTCEVEVDGESDDRGILGLDDSIVAGPLSMRIRLRLSANDADSKTLTELAQWAVDHCPVSDAVRRAVPIELEIIS
ncbi:MAG: OsmC family protein [Acidimicrobiia bacterium]